MFIDVFISLSRYFNWMPDLNKLFNIINIYGKRSLKFISVSSAMAHLPGLGYTTVGAHPLDYKIDDQRFPPQL